MGPVPDVNSPLMHMWYREENREGSNRKPRKNLLKKHSSQKTKHEADYR